MVAEQCLQGNCCRAMVAVQWRQGNGTTPPWGQYIGASAMAPVQWHQGNGASWRHCTDGFALKRMRGEVIFRAILVRSEGGSFFRAILVRSEGGTM